MSNLYPCWSPELHPISLLLFLNVRGKKALYFEISDKINSVTSCFVSSDACLVTLPFVVLCEHPEGGQNHNYSKTITPKEATDAVVVFRNVRISAWPGDSEGIQGKLGICPRWIWSPGKTPLSQESGLGWDCWGCSTDCGLGRASPEWDFPAFRAGPVSQPSAPLTEICLFNILFASLKFKKFFSTW